MQSIAIVTGADRGLGHALCTALLEQGWQVYAGQYMPEWSELTSLKERFHDQLQIIPLDVTNIQTALDAAKTISTQSNRVDLLINNAGVISPHLERTITEPQDYAEIHRLYDTNALGPLRMVEAFLPLLRRSDMKRLCFVSSEAGSIERCHRRAWYGYCMSKAALNMAVKILHNDLRPEGFTFRLYHPGWMRTYMGGVKNSAGDMEPEEAASKALPFFLADRDDEDRLAMTDYLGSEWPW